MGNAFHSRTKQRRYPKKDITQDVSFPQQYEKLLDLSHIEGSFQIPIHTKEITMYNVLAGNEHLVTVESEEMCIYVFGYDTKTHILSLDLKSINDVSDFYTDMRKSKHIPASADQRQVALYHYSMGDLCFTQLAGDDTGSCAYATHKPKIPGPKNWDQNHFYFLGNDHVLHIMQEQPDTGPIMGLIGTQWDGSIYFWVRSLRNNKAQIVGKISDEANNHKNSIYSSVGSVESCVRHVYNKCTGENRYLVMVSYQNNAHIPYLSLVSFTLHPTRAVAVPQYRNLKQFDLNKLVTEYWETMQNGAKRDDGQCFVVEHALSPDGRTAVFKTGHRNSDGKEQAIYLLDVESESITFGLQLREHHIVHSQSIVWINSQMFIFLGFYDKDADTEEKSDVYGPESSTEISSKNQNPLSLETQYDKPSGAKTSFTESLDDPEESYYTMDELSEDEDEFELKINSIVETFTSMDSYDSSETVHSDYTTENEQLAAVSENEQERREDSSYSISTEGDSRSQSFTHMTFSDKYCKYKLYVCYHHSLYRKMRETLYDLWCDFTDDEDSLNSSGYESGVPYELVYLLLEYVGDYTITPVSLGLPLLVNEEENTTSKAAAAANTQSHGNGTKEATPSSSSTNLARLNYLQSKFNSLSYVREWQMLFFREERTKNHFNLFAMDLKNVFKQIPCIDDMYI